MTKDRLSELKMKLNENNKKAIPVSSDSSSKSYKNVKKTFERAEVLSQWIEAIEENIREIRQYLKRIEDIKYNQKDVREKLDSLFQKNTSISHKITGKLKELQADIDENNESAQGRIESIQYNSLKTRFQGAFRSHTSELENYATIQKSILKAHLKAKGELHVTDEELTALIDEGKEVQIFTENILTETAEAKRMVADIEERHDQLLKIEGMLTEVRDLFVQLAILVDTQKDTVDRIEYQAQTARDYVVSGIGELDDAKKKKNKYLKRKIYCGVGITIVIIIIIIVLLVPRS